MRELSPVETICISPTSGRARLVGESNRLRRGRWAALGINAAGCVRIVLEIQQAMREVCRCDERRKEEDKEEGTSRNLIHVSGGGRWEMLELERPDTLVYIRVLIGRGTLEQW